MVKSFITVLAQEAKPVALILMVTVLLSAAGIKVGLAVVPTPPEIEPFPLIIVQEIVAGSVLAKEADNDLLIPSQKKPSLVKVITACLEILIFKVLTIGLVQGAFGVTVNVK